MIFPLLDLALEVPVVDVLAFKLETLGFVVVISYCFFMCLKRVKEIGGFKELYKTLFKEEGQGVSGRAKARSGRTP